MRRFLASFACRSSRLPVAIVLFACAIASACSKSTERSTSFTDVTGAETTIETAGLRIEITGHVRYVNHSESSTTGGSSSVTTIFDVYGGTTYKGMVRIQDVQPSMSAGVILCEKAKLVRGDSATTQL